MKWLIGCVALFLFAACGDSMKIPGDIIAKPKMEKILWDMVRADRFVNNFLPKPNDSAFDKKEIVAVYEGVFKVHGISRDDFFKSYKYYLGRPDIARVMFDSIAAQAERRRAEVYQKPKADSLKLRRDSIKLRQDSLKPRLDSIKKKLLRK